MDARGTMDGERKQLQGGPVAGRGWSADSNDAVGASRKRFQYPELTGLRCVAAMAVLAAHGLHAVFRSDSVLLHHLALQMAYLSLTLFFVLSGCVMTINYAIRFQESPAAAFREFWSARIARLYPLYLFAMLLYLAFVPLTRTLTFRVLPWNLLLLQTWTFAWVDQAPVALYFFPYAWSISVELFLYVTFPLASYFLWRTDRPSVALGAFVGLFSVTLVVLLQAGHSVNGGAVSWCGVSVVSPTQFLQWLAYYAPYSHIASFFAGCIVGKWLILQEQQGTLPYATQRSSWALSVLAGVLLAGLFLIVPPDSQRPLSPWDLPKHGMIYSPVIACFVWFAVRGRSWISTVLSSRPMLHLGDMSYSIYLIHPMIAGLFCIGLAPGEPARPDDPSRWIRFAAIIASTICFSYGSYNLIEVPGKRVLRSLLTRERRPACGMQAAA